MSTSKNSYRYTGDPRSGRQNYNQDHFCNDCWRDIATDKPEHYTYTGYGEKRRTCKACMKNWWLNTFPTPPDEIRQKLPLTKVQDDLQIPMCTYCRVRSGKCRIKLSNMKHRLCQECTFYALSGDAEDSNSLIEFFKCEMLDCETETTIEYEMPNSRWYCPSCLENIVGTTSEEVKVASEKHTQDVMVVARGGNFTEAEKKARKDQILKELSR